MTKENTRATVKEGFSIFLSLLGVPSLLAIFGGILIIWGKENQQSLVVLIGIFWIMADCLIFREKIKKFYEEIANFF
ncbi:MAG: hypothetical protein AABX53_03940 [Nanoarchaeota archaeon]